uniref:Probable G-protein coupled receptor 128 n=1 Tax=Phallusia mammillata TaxID=59560 RepID=A0A6F9DE67_9ASCI|nr:probable G-protein coupled receptor 128 [Phallusia mammillata]
MASFTPNSGSYTPISNNVVTYTCIAGYEIDGSAAITCKDSGEWTTSPQCQQIVAPEDIFLHEFAQDLDSSQIDIGGISQKLKEDLLQIFQSGSVNVQNVFIESISNSSVVRYLVQFTQFQPSNVFLTMYQDFIKTNQINDLILQGVPRTTSCKGLSFGGFVFPEVSANKLSYSVEICPKGFSQASLRCSPCIKETNNGLLHTSKYDLTSLSVAKCETTIRSLLINTSDVTKESVEQVASSLQIITSGTDLQPEEIEDSLEVVNSIAQAVTEVTKDTLVNVVTVITSASESLEMMSENIEVSSEHVNEMRKNITQSLSFFAHRVSFDNDTGSSIEIKTKSVSLKVVEQSMQIDPAALWFAPEVSNAENVVPINASIPGSVLSKAQSQMNGKKFKTVFLLHKGNFLFPSNKSPEFVITVEVGNGTSLTELNPPVSIKHRNEKAKYGQKHISTNLKAEKVRQQCAYWDPDVSDWKTDGCCLDNSAHPPECKCDHLTSFALLVSTVEVPQDVVLSIVSDVGCGFSIFCFVATIILHLLNKPQLRKGPNQIQLHVCINLLVAYVVFLFGVSKVEYSEVCTVLTVVMQYTFLTSWMWMAVYSHKLYTALVKVFTVSSKSYMMKACIFAYGFPFLVVGMNVCLTFLYFDKLQFNEDLCVKGDPKYLSSTYRAENMCWLHGSSLFVGFLLIVGLVLVNNIVILVLVLVKLFCKRQKIKSTAKKFTTSQQVVMACILSFTLGITWVLGIFMLFATDETYHLVLNWLFTLFNSFQGVFLFYITCVKREDMFNFWWNPIRARLCCHCNLSDDMIRRFSFAASSDATKSSAAATVSPSHSNLP